MKSSKSGIKHGTVLQFKASRKYFGPESKFPYKDCVKWLETLMHFPMNNPNIKVEMNIFDIMKLKESYKFKQKKFSDLIDKYLSDGKERFAPVLNLSGSTTMDEYINGEKKKKNLRVDVAISYDPNYETCYDSYCNYTNTTNGGIHVETVEKAFCNFMQVKCRDKMTDNQKEKTPIIWNDIRSGLVMIVNLSTDAQVRFEGNMKDRIGNPELARPISDIVFKELNKIFNKEADIFDKFIRIIKDNAKNRVELQKLRTATKTERMNNLSEHAIDKYIPCMNSGREYKALYLVEGASAGGSVRNALNPRTDAVLLLRGNIPNVSGMSISDMMKNTEIKLMVTVMRCGIGPTFDINKLYFDRINIMTDQDVDGFNISSEILALFYYYFPEIIKAGKLYKITTPLYQLDDKDHPFVHNKKEMIEIYHKKIIKKYKIKFEGDDEYASKSEITQFLEDTYDYREDLINAAKSLGKTNKFLVEIAIAYLVMLDAVRDDNDVDRMNEALEKQKFLSVYMNRIQKNPKFKEVIYKDHRVQGIVEGHYRLVKLAHRFLKKVSTLIPIYKKYGYIIKVKEKDGDSRKMTIGEFLDMCYEFYPVRLHRFKGLSEINAKDLKNTAMDFNNRVSTVYTLSSAKRELEESIMETVHGKKEKNLKARKKMMEEYKIHKDDIDN